MYMLNLLKCFASFKANTLNLIKINSKQLEGFLKQKVATLQ